MKNCVVTGGAGFIGSHVTELLLKEGHSVCVLDNFSTGRAANLEHLRENSNLDVVSKDIAVDDIESYFEGVDWVFHLAALADIVPSIERPESYFRSNVDGTFSVLQAAKNHQVSRFTYAASSSCYGIPEQYPTAETAVISPQYPYALTKWLGEELVMHWSQVYGLPAVSLRFFNVYGPRSRTHGTYGAVFGVFLAQKLAGKPFTVVGDGTQTRDFTYVTDVASAMLTAAQSEVSAEIMNVGSGGTYSINELTSLLGGEVVYIPKRPGEPDCTFADVSKIEDLLGWKALVPLDEGVKRLLECIDYWKEAPVWEPDGIAKATESWFTHLGSKKEG